MENLHSGLKQYLASKAAITTLVAQRIYQDAAPEGAKQPYLVFRRVADHNEPHLSGVSSIAQAQYQITCWAETTTQREELYDAVRNVLDGYSGTWGTITIRLVQLGTGASAPEEEFGESAQLAECALMVFTIWYLRAAPTG